MKQKMLHPAKQNNTIPEVDMVPMHSKRLALCVPNWLGQMVRFALVGVFNTLIDLFLYYLLSRWVLGSSASRTLIKGVSYLGGVMNSFFWNKSWTFRSNANARKVFIPFVLTTLLAVGLNAGIMHVSLEMFHLPESISLTLATVSVFVWNFTTNKFVVFKADERSSSLNKGV